MELIGALLVLGIMVGAVAFMFRGTLGPRIRNLDVSKAGRTSSSPGARPWNMYLPIWLLAIVSSLLTLLDLAPQIGQGTVPVTLAVVGVAAFGYAFDSSLVLFILSVSGLFGAAASLAAAYGAPAVGAVLVLSAMVLWLAGLVRSIKG